MFPCLEDTVLTRLESQRGSSRSEHCLSRRGLGVGWHLRSVQGGPGARVPAILVIILLSRQADHNRRATGIVVDMTRPLGLAGLAVVGVANAALPFAFWREGQNCPMPPHSTNTTPLLTYRDDATGERTELSAADLGDWTARTASLLKGHQLGAGDRIAVLLPPHWQTAAVLLGAWSIGVTVSFRPWATAGLAPEHEPFDAVFVARRRLDSWLETVPEAWHRFVLGLAPNGATLDAVPAGYRDYLAEVREQPGTPPGYGAIRNTDIATADGTSYQQWEEVARGIAAALDLGAGDRLLVNVAEHEEPVKWLLAPLAVGASIVLYANLDPGTVDARVAAEGVTHVL